MIERGKYNCVVCGENLPPTLPRNIFPDGSQQHWDEEFCLSALNKKLRAENDVLRAQLKAVEYFFRYREEQLDSDDLIASCNCTTKTPDITYHKKGCKYRLISERNNARAELARVGELYSDLLYQVAQRVEGETRHETAKRIIRQSETPDPQAAAQVGTKND